MSIGASLVLIAVGLILAVALNLDPTPIAGVGVEWETIGWILTIVGLIGLVWSLILLQNARRGTGYVTDTRVADPRDEMIVEERSTRHL